MHWPPPAIVHYIHRNEALRSAGRRPTRSPSPPVSLAVPRVVPQLEVVDPDVGIGEGRGEALGKEIAPVLPDIVAEHLRRKRRIPDSATRPTRYGVSHCCALSHHSPNMGMHWIVFVSTVVAPRSSRTRNFSTAPS